LYEIAVRKLNFDDSNKNDFQLVAIHTALEDYKLAYLINKKSTVNLQINQDDE
jgi:hypothetical protein